MLARRWYQCRNQIQKLTCAQPQFNRSLLLLLLLRPVPLQRRTRQPVAHLRPPPAHTSRSPANIGRAQYRNSRSRPALSCAATRTPACSCGWETGNWCQQVKTRTRGKSTTSRPTVARWSTSPDSNRTVRAMEAKWTQLDAEFRRQAGPPPEGKKKMVK